MGLRGPPRPGAGSPTGRGYPQQGYPQQGYPQQGYPQQGGPRNQPGVGGAVKFNAQARNQPIPVGLPGQMYPGDYQQQQQQQQQLNAAEPLDHNILAEADPQTQKNMIGERLYPLINHHEPARAAKITGMLLEMEITELLNLLESPDALIAKVLEARMVLEQHERTLQQQESQ